LQYGLKDFQNKELKSLLPRHGNAGAAGVYSGIVLNGTGRNSHQRKYQQAQ
jgi:hypothetical protein